MAGQLIYRKPIKPPKPPPPPPHECWRDRPAARGFSYGDIWLCECGKKWRVGDGDGMKIFKRHLRPLWFKKRKEGWLR